MNNHHIDELVSKALALAECEAPPVPVEKIATKFEIQVVPFDFHDGVSAVFKKDRGVIGVNKNHHPVRQRFSVAHELGHFLLGHDIGIDDLVEEGFSKTDPKEREANAFASALLMPTVWIKKSVAQNGLDIEKLARIYDVSKQSITIRLLGLNLIK